MHNKIIVGLFVLVGAITAVYIGWSVTMGSSYQAAAAIPPSNLSPDELALLLEDVHVADNYRYDAKDDRGNGLDTLKAIPLNRRKYIGIYHSLTNGSFRIRVGESDDLMRWTFRRDLDGDASHGDIVAMPEGDFLVAYEKNESGKSHIRIRHYKNWKDLKRGRFMGEIDLPHTLSTTNEGTPNFISVDKKPIRRGVQDWSGSAIELGFHYYDGTTDHNATGTLVDFKDWTSSENTVVNNYFDSRNYGGNYGDRDDLLLTTSAGAAEYTIIEAQSFHGRWESWRSALQNHASNAFQMLDPYTHNRSLAFGNPTVSRMKLPSGEYGYFVTYYIFSEGAAPGEAGQLIFYTAESNLSSATPRDLRPPHDSSMFEIACSCNTPGGTAPNNDFTCSDGDFRYCAADEYCTDFAIRPVWPCSRL